MFCAVLGITMEGLVLGLQLSLPPVWLFLSAAGECSPQGVPLLSSARAHLNAGGWQCWAVFHHIHYIFHDDLLSCYLPLPSSAYH